MTNMPRVDLLHHAMKLAKAYNGNLTLRQLYYRFVATGLTPNTDKDYKRLGDVLAQARYEGRFPLEWLIDRTREARPGDFTQNDVDVDVAMDAAADDIRHLPFLIRRDRWLGQRRFVSVFVEKEALAGVFEAPCNKLGVSWFVCRGYPSVSALWQWVQAYAAAAEAADDLGEGLDGATILYFGDHDPDGIEIPESSLRGIRTLINLKEPHLPTPDLRVVALTTVQIQEHDPPPFPAKQTSSRFDAYVKRTGLYDAWELDALEPATLTKLIYASVQEMFDADRYALMQNDVKAARIDMIERIKAPGWVDDVLQDID